MMWHNHLLFQKAEEGGHSFTTCHISHRIVLGLLPIDRLLGDSACDVTGDPRCPNE